MKLRAETQRRADVDRGPQRGLPPSEASTTSSDGRPQPPSRLRSWVTEAARVTAIMRRADEATVEAAVVRLSRAHRILAPLALVVGAFVMLFDGLKLLISNWRLTIVQLLPAIWIWLAMTDLKAHALHGKSFTIITGPLLVGAMILITAMTAASFFLNAVFAFAITVPGTPDTPRGRSLA